MTPRKTLIDPAERSHRVPAIATTPAYLLSEPEEDISDAEVGVRVGASRAGTGLMHLPEELRREDEATCSGYGFHPGTDAFATCPQQESLARLYSGPPPSPYWDGVFGGVRAGGRNGLSERF